MTIKNRQAAGRPSSGFETHLPKQLSRVRVRKVS